MPNIIIDNLPALSGAPTTGDEIPIERSSAAYKIDYSALASAIRSKVSPASGTKQFGSIAANSATNDTISIGKTLSSANYFVLTETVTGNIAVGIQEKTTTSFKMYIRNNTSSAATGTVTWAIIMNE